MMWKALIAGITVMVALSAAVDTRLADAAERGDRAAIATLLKQKVDVNTPQGDGTTALHWAAFRDDLDMTRMLLAAGADVKVATREGAITPIFMACTNGDAAMIDALLKAGADVNSAKTNGTTALMTAAASGSVDAVKVLLDKGADANAKEKVHGQTAIMFAAAVNRADVIRLLAKRGADVNAATAVEKVARVRFDQDGNIIEDRPAPAGAKPAAAPKAGAAAGSLVEEEAKADAEADARAAAEAAAKAEEEKKKLVAQLQSDLDLLARSMQMKSANLTMAPVKARAGDLANRFRRVGPEFMGGMTGLLYATREGNMDAVKALVESGADVNVQSPGDKFTPVVEAIVNGHLDMAKYLIEKGADPNKATIAGMTPLYAAVDVQWAPKAWYPQHGVDQEKTSYLEIMQMLVDKGASVNAQIADKPWFRSFTNDYTWIDPAGATAFWRAAQSNDVAAMKLLVKAGADPKMATKLGATPLMAAAGVGWAANWSVNAPGDQVEAVKYAVELGNDVKAAESRGYTPLHGAAYLGNNEMIKYLISKGADIKAKSKTGDTVADMANGPTRFGQPHPESVVLLEQLGSVNNHNCRSDQCVVAARTNVYDRPLSVAEQAEKDSLDRFAISLGFKEADYKQEGVRAFPGQQ